MYFCNSKLMSVIISLANITKFNTIALAPTALCVPVTFTLGSFLCHWGFWKVLLICFVQRVGQHLNQKNNTSINFSERLHWKQTLTLNMFLLSVTSRTQFRQTCMLQAPGPVSVPTLPLSQANPDMIHPDLSPATFLTNSGWSLEESIWKSHW